MPTHRTLAAWRDLEDQPRWSARRTRIAWIGGAALAGGAAAFAPVPVVMIAVGVAATALVVRALGTLRW